MRKIIVLVSLVVLVAITLTTKDRLLSGNILFDGQVTKKSTEAIWKEIKYLDKMLYKTTPISIYFNSNGGDAQAITILVERIHQLQKSGRKFHGTIFGYCFSACGSIFALMDKRYMTKNAVYMQHRSWGRGNNPTSIKLRYLIDTRRFIGDARMLRYKPGALIFLLSLGDFVASSKKMLKYKLIHGIVDQPEL